MSCHIAKASIATPIGPYELEVCQRGIHALLMSKEVTDDNFLSLGVEEVSQLEKKCSTNPIVNSVEEWLKIYFSKNTKKDFPEVLICPNVIDEQSNTFSHKILSTLKREVGFQETISYGQLAVKSGSTVGSARAVGTVMANNKIVLIVPCHRVIKSDGSEGNYAKSSKNSVKKWLLNHERKTNDN